MFGVPDDKKGPAVARAPAGTKILDQQPLVQAGILKFIHQDMVDSLIENELQVRGGLIAAQDPQGSLFQFDKVDDAAVPA